MDSQRTQQKNTPLRNLTDEELQRLTILQRDASVDRAELDFALTAFQIRGVRQFRRRSLNYLARRLNVSERTLARYETGAVKMPITVAIRLLNLLGYRVVIEKTK